MTYRRGWPILDQDGSMLSGTLAARPAAGTVPVGSLYFATDNGIAYEQVGGVWTTAPYSPLSASDVPDISATYQARSEKNAASGYAGLSAASLLAAAQIPDLSATYQAVSAKNANNGYCGLDAGADVAAAQLGNAVESIKKSGAGALHGDVTLSEGSNITLTQAGQDISIAAAGGAAGIGAVLFDSTLGADAASIDTGAAGIAQTQNVLHVYVIARTSEAVVNSTITMRVNNDATAIYDRQMVSVDNATVAGSNTLAATSWAMFAAGDNTQAGSAGTVFIVIPGYRQTTFHKSGVCREQVSDDTAADVISTARALRWRSTVAISRLAITAGSGNLRAGSRLLILGF